MAGETHNQEGMTQSGINFGDGIFLTIYAADLARSILFLTAISMAATVSRSLRNDNKISGQNNFHFQNLIVVAFPKEKGSVFGRYSSLPPMPPPSKTQNVIFIVVSPSLSIWRVFLWPLLGGHLHLLATLLRTFGHSFWNRKSDLQGFKNELEVTFWGPGYPERSLLSHFWSFAGHFSSGTEKGVITKGVFSLEESLESLKSLNSLESLENGRTLFVFHSLGFSRMSRISKFSRISRKSTFLERPPFQKTPFPKDPFFWSQFLGVGRVTFESLFGNFNDLGVLGSVGASADHKPRIFSRPRSEKWGKFSCPRSEKRGKE